MKKLDIIRLSVGWVVGIVFGIFSLAGVATLAKMLNIYAASLALYWESFVIVLSLLAIFGSIFVILILTIAVAGIVAWVLGYKE